MADIVGAITSALGGEKVKVTNFDDVEDPMYQAFKSIYADREGKADKWNEIYAQEIKRYEQQKIKNIKEWFEQAKVQHANALEDGQRWRVNELLIAIAQQAMAYHYAERDYNIQKNHIKRMLDMHNTQKKWAERYQNAWYVRYYPLEIKLLEKFQARFDDENYGKPNYDVAKSRAVVTVRSEFAKARDKVRKCHDPRHVGAICHSLKTLAIAESKAITGAVEKGYRAEEAKSETKKAGNDEALFNLIKLGRGLQTNSLSALNSAQTSAKIASTYDPYESYQQATAMTTGYWLQHSANKVERSEMTANRLNSQLGAYRSMGVYQPRNQQGYDFNTMSPMLRQGYFDNQMSNNIFDTYGGNYRPYANQ